MPTQININEFLHFADANPVVDVRTPAEYEKGHIPGAINIPLFSNEERAIVGTIYKQQSRQAAIDKGLELVGPKLKSIIESVRAAVSNGTILIHCWRGGMRSSSVAWLLELCGFKAYTLKGGYKHYRNHVLNSFKTEKKLVVLGGKTGSAKTHVLNLLKQKGEQVIDLEAIAKHKGSSFGKLGEEISPTQEQFENILAREWQKIIPEQICWIEDESRLIGNKVVPDALWIQIRNAAVLFIDIPFEERTNFLVREYGKYSIEELTEATKRIQKRLGGQHAKAALLALQNNDLKTACEINLVYYDKAYLFGLNKRDKNKITVVPFDKMDVENIANEIIKWKL